MQRLQHNPTLTVDGRPNEGDLLYFPLTKDLYEIKFVEREDPFYQLGKIYYYTMTAEIYEYGSDDISTGVPEIDEIETLFSSAIALTLSVGGTGDFTIGETVTGSTTGVDWQKSSLGITPQECSKSLTEKEPLPLANL